MVFLMPLLILAAAEIILGFFHLERWDTLFVKSRSSPVFIDETLPGGNRVLVTNPAYDRSIDQNQITYRKAPGINRIFVTGGSAAYGWPMKNESSFSGFLSRAFSAVSPNTYEIINLAGMSYGSHRVRDMVSQVLQYEPDAVIIYSGNNEYVENNLFPQIDEKGVLYALRDQLRRLDLYRAIRLLLFKSPLADMMRQRQGMDITDPDWSPLVSRAESSRNVERDEKVLENFEWNITSAVRDIRRQGADTILMTVPVNLAGWRPVDHPHPPEDADATTRWKEVWKTASAAALDDDFEASTKYFSQLQEMRPTSARARYYLGNSLRMLGRSEEAGKKLKEALDLDARPFRARSAINVIVRRIARQEDVQLVDLEKFFIGLSDDGIIDSRYFLDYCHPDGEGHRIIASEVARKLAEVGLLSNNLEPLIAQISWDNYQSKDPEDIAGYYYALGMTHQFNGLIEEAEKAYRRLLQIDPDHTMGLSNLGVILYKRGDKNGAGSLFEQSLKADPSNPVALANYGIIQMENGNTRVAREPLLKAVRLNPTNYRVHLALGKLYVSERSFSQAIESLNEAQKLAVPDVDLFRLRGKAWLGLGDRDRALADILKARDLDPSNSEIQEMLKSFNNPE